MRAFTLVELLIVVAIIAVLAAIAVPNFLEAQVRAKVSRARAEMKTVATALEAYTVDNRKYPHYGNPKDYRLGAVGHATTFVPVRLTTPISYLSTIPVDAGFGDISEHPLQGAGDYLFHNNYQSVYLGSALAAGHVQVHYRKLTGDSSRPVEWLLWSPGPDRRNSNNDGLYDPTNGSLSRGDLMLFGP